MDEQKSINFDHTNGTIYTSDDSVVTIDNAILIGDGANLPDNDPDNVLEDGLLKVCLNKDGKPNLYQTDRNGKWKKIGEPYDETLEMIYSIIMSE